MPLNTKSSCTDRCKRIAASALLFATCVPAFAQQATAETPKRYVVKPPVEIPNPYGAYEFLIGDWDTKPTAGPDLGIHQQFRWGTKKSFIQYTTFTTDPGRSEAIHFEGMLVWNGASKNLDFLIVGEPGSGAQEKGTRHVEADGAIVRDVTMTRPDGGTATFRQTFRRTDDTHAVTSLMRQASTGWEPNFPGSEKLEMVKRAPTG